MESGAQATARPRGGKRGASRGRHDGAGARWDRLALAAALLGGVVAAALFLVGTFVATPDLRLSAPEQTALLGAEALSGARFAVEGSSSALESATWRLNGEDVSDRATSEGDRATLRLPSLPEGEHTVSVSVSGALPWSSTSVSWNVAVDTTPPEVQIEAETLAAERGETHELRGAVEPGAQLQLGDTDIPLHDGAFAVSFSTPPRAPLTFVATDAAGNESSRTVSVSIAPRQPDKPVRGVHVTASAWSNEGLRTEILSLVDEGLINAVELDLKDELGEVGYDSKLELAQRTGAVKGYYKLEEAVELLHSKGVRVIGRLVVFNDPILTEWAWSNGRRRQVVQTPDGGRYAGYGGFSNPANANVRAYNIAIAEEAARAGVDDILYDYIRRPDGPLETMVFPGLKTDLERVVVTFLEETAERLEPYDTFVGASVFGIAALRPQDVAQDVKSMAEHLDYVAPMVYPSHWSSGVYDVDDPNNDPYAIVRRSLEDFGAQVEGRGARILPWLQDFSFGVTYGPEEVRAQIEAARDAGVDEWLLWDPEVTYTSEALDPLG